jgi:PKD repeat protein
MSTSGCSHEQPAQKPAPQPATATATAAPAAAPQAEQPKAKVTVPAYLLNKPITFTASADPDEGAPPLTVKFTVDMLDTVVSPKYTWNFGDDSPESHEESPTHTYQKLGKYKVILRITDDANGRTGTDDTDVDVIPPEEVIPEVTPQPTVPADASAT